MSYEDLEEHNIFLPKEHWGKLDLGSSVNQTLLGISFIIGITSCVLMIVGGGHLLTWIGTGLFLIFMFSFSAISIAGINNQNDTIDEVKDE